MRAVNGQPRTERQREVLSSLASVEAAMHLWLTPRMFGGRDWSHHARTAAQLVAMGLVEVKKLHSLSCWCGKTYEGRKITRCTCKGSRRFRITPRGRRAHEIASRNSETVKLTGDERRRTRKAGR